MRLQYKGLVVVGALLAMGLGTSSTAGATTTAPAMDTSTFACGSGVCEVGPGDVGVAFAAGLDVYGDGVSQSVEKFYGDDFRMSVVSGSLPPGLQLTLPSSEWTITGTPTKAGSYTFAVQFSPTQDIAPNGGPSGTQQLTITIGTGTSDRIVLFRAVYSAKHRTLQLAGYDANAGETFQAYATASGALLGTITENTSWNDGSFLSNIALASPPASVTLKDSLGGSVTMAVVINRSY